MRDGLRTFFLMLMTLLMLVMPVCAEEASDPARPEALTVIDEGTVKEILKSDLIMLDSSRRYRLDNILVPPYEDAPAVDELKREFLNKTVTVYGANNYNTGNGVDRYGAHFAHVVTDKGVWIQEELIAKGLAWAFTSETNPQMMGALKRVEEKARAAQLGFWKKPAYAIKTPDNVEDFENSYQIVEGRILSVTVKAHTGTVFFNFGKDWQNDFAVRVHDGFSDMGLIDDPDFHEKNRTSAFNRNGNPLQWQNRIVRVRGWVSGGSGHGPVIDVTHKEQIDFVPQNAKSMDGK